MTKILKTIFILYLVLLTRSFAQESLNSVLDYTLSYRGLTRDDITIPIDFFTAGEKSPTNDSKLLLPLVKDMMINPLKTIEWMDEVERLKDLKTEDLILKMFEMINYRKDLKHQSYSFTTNINDLLYIIEERLQQSKKNEERLLKVFSKGEILFLSENLLSIIEETDKDDPGNLDIFKFNRARDSSAAVSRRTMDLLSKVNRELIFKNSIKDFEFYYQLYEFVNENKKYLNKYFEFGPDGVYPNKFGAVIDIDGRKIIIAGKENNVYQGNYALIIDLGGNDVYNIESRNRIGDNFSCIIDLSGKDYYTASGNFSLAGSVFSSGFIFDKEGDDTYKGNNISLGAAVCGLGLLYDEGGNDVYQGISFSIGAGAFGVGLVADINGNDIYTANSYSQGFGMTEGIGAIVDNTGNDSYLVDSRSLDIGRYEDHYVSMCQGYGLGLRPYYAGGIGLIIEGEGNDIYNTDIFGQGGAYWYSLGAIVDKSGHDKYNGYQYSQGAGIHLAVGLLKDYGGWDFYTSNGVSQGCGHDFGFGFLWDVKGNDNYSSYSLSQGAGNANGIGILIDESGRDGYLSKEPGNTRGYGNPRREFGSLGIFIDASGEDFYSVGGMDSTILNSSSWGVTNDYTMTDKPTQISGNGFRVEVDSTDRPHDIPFSVEEYFIMAKTIEPRFSLWQEYGFRKLTEDSINTSGFISTKLGTDDHRETLLMRNLARRIRYSIMQALLKKLEVYIEEHTIRSENRKMNQADVSFACFLLGEAANPLSKEMLLQLTYDENLRIRVSAVNALGKIKLDTADTEFNKRVRKRLAEMFYERLEWKLYNKDIAFALKQYKTKEDMELLKDMLMHEYYGVRFTAEEALKELE